MRLSTFCGLRRDQEQLVRSNKAAGGFFGFQNAMSEPAEKEGNLQNDKH